jgi:hypothetical protein
MSPLAARASPQMMRRLGHEGLPSMSSMTDDLGDAANRLEVVG